MTTKPQTPKEKPLSIERKYKSGILLETNFTDKQGLPRYALSWQQILTICAEEREIRDKQIKTKVEIMQLHFCKNNIKSIYPCNECINCIKFKEQFKEFLE